MHLLYARGLGRFAQLAVDLPLGGSDATPLGYIVNDASGASPYRSFKPRAGFVLGDLRIETKARLWASTDRRLRVGAAASVTVPSSLLTSDAGTCEMKDGCSFMGERGSQVTALGIVELAARATCARGQRGGRTGPRQLSGEVGAGSPAAAAQYAPLRTSTSRRDRRRVTLTPRATRRGARRAPYGAMYACARAGEGFRRVEARHRLGRAQ